MATPANHEISNLHQDVGASKSAQDERQLTGREQGRREGKEAAEPSTGALRQAVPAGWAAAAAVGTTHQLKPTIDCELARFP